MATNLVSNAYMNNLLKTVYLKGVFNNKYQGSVTLSKVGKEKWDGGEKIEYAAQYANGGNFGSDYAALVNAPTDGARNIKWQMQYGYLTGWFDIDQPELLVAQNDSVAFMGILENKMAATFDGLSKMLATYMFGGQYGVIDQVSADITLSGTSHTFPLTMSGAMKLDLGSRFVIATAGSANAALPSSPLLGSGTVFTVTKIRKNSITATTAAAVSDTVYAGDYLEIYTSRQGATVLGPEGLADLIPYVGDRENDDAVWQAYIGTQFRGVDRSIAEDRLAGQFAVAAASGNYRLSETLSSLLKDTVAAGGRNNVVVINNNTFEKIAKELDLSKNLWQQFNGGNEKNGYTAGLSNLDTAFGQAFISRTIIDPYCPEDKAYMFEFDDLKFYDLGNVSRVINPVANDEVGKHDIEAVGSQGLGDEITPKLNWDKLFNIEQGVPGTYGPGMRVSANIYGNFALRKTGSAGVAILK